jgi:hypothetical protein
MSDISVSISLQRPNNRKITSSRRSDEISRKPDSKGTMKAPDGETVINCLNQTSSLAFRNKSPGIFGKIHEPMDGRLSILFGFGFVFFRVLLCVGLFLL